MPNWFPLVVAAVPGVAALIVAWVNNRAQRRTAVALEELRHRGATETLRQALRRRYQEPLARAAYELQSRLWNILTEDLLQRYADDRDSRAWRYACDSTMWLFAQYFGWVEVLRREVQYIPPAPGADRRLPALLGEVAHALSSYRRWPGTAFQVFRAEQRALGEVVIVPGFDADGAQRAACMGFAEFRIALEDVGGPVARGFASLQDDLIAASQDRLLGRARLRALQHALIDLIDQLDADHDRFPVARDKVE